MSYKFNTPQAPSTTQANPNGQHASNTTLPIPSNAPGTHNLQAGQFSSLGFSSGQPSTHAASHGRPFQSLDRYSCWLASLAMADASLLERCTRKEILAVRVMGMSLLATGTYAMAAMTYKATVDYKAAWPLAVKS